ncbi:argonaute 4-like protein [Tanacetum coccineum]|uniref:Argonaute 4-like protein n=1 Tax=Tanacetum coccineum TaxID=301880 RepID=A0ABQ5B7D6_9ASTR
MDPKKDMAVYRFSLKQKTKNRNGEPETLEVTVYDYFVNIIKIDLRYSGDLLCINVGRPKSPTYIPLEKSRQKPQKRMRVLNDALNVKNYDAEPLLKSCGPNMSDQAILTMKKGEISLFTLPPDLGFGYHLSLKSSSSHGSPE